MKNNYDTPDPTKDMFKDILNEIAEEEDKRILRLLDFYTKDLELINSLDYGQLPLYINYKFRTLIANELLKYRIINNCIITKQVSFDIITKHVNKLTERE